MGLHAVAASQLVSWLLNTIDQTNLDKFFKSATSELTRRVTNFSVGRTKDAISAGTAQTPPLCRRDYTFNDVSICVRMFRQLQRLLGPAYIKSTSSIRVSEGQ